MRCSSLEFGRFQAAAQHGWGMLQLARRAQFAQSELRSDAQGGALCHHAALILTALSLVVAAHAQDTRNVTEPAIPPSCAVLTAKLAAIDGNKTVADADEAKLDTGRIQQAMDTCAKGQAVVLKAAGALNAFLTGSLDLKPGVTLVVDAKTILFGSRDAKVYEVRPGSCGIVSQAGRGCRAMINGTGVAGAGVMGDGDRKSTRLNSSHAN